MDAGDDFLSITVPTFEPKFYHAITQFSKIPKIIINAVSDEDKQNINCLYY